ncbi:EFR1 family ferrodoxin [bacterium]|nr:EFR1 family ferrodoxin [bacterium]
MKGIIYYYSGSGNTELACRYIAGKVKNASFKLCNIAGIDRHDPNKYDIVGFATWADFMGAPQLFHSFVGEIESQGEKPAFIFNTFGAVSGNTLRDMENAVKAKGFNVIRGHSLHTPENYPPSIKRGMGFAKSPGKRDIKKFDAFIAGLETDIKELRENRTVKQTKIKLGLSNSIMPKLPRTQARKDMGEKFVDGTLCNECGICVKVCPYNAVELSPKPVFDMSACYGCWACYNHCPEQAIFTKKIRGIGHYPRPIEQLATKLKP